MKKLIFAASVALCILLASASVYFAADNAMRQNHSSSYSEKELRDLRDRISELEDKPECFAVLRETDGIIGLYDSDGKILICTIDTPVISLPERQRSQITVGMEIESSSDFMRLYENLSQ